MRKVILMTLLTVVSSSAAAEWVAIARHKTETDYADPTTIRRTGNMVKMWNLFDFKTVEAAAFAVRPATGLKPFLSYRTQTEYDCKEGQYRWLFIDYFSGNMARGETLGRVSDPSPWEPVPPGSIGELEWKFACGNK